MFGITQNTINELNNIFHKYENIEKVIIFGSRAKGDLGKAQILILVAV